MRHEYRCKDCRKKFEVEVITTSALEGRRKVSPKCPTCGSKSVVKLISKPAIIFKGTGFYKTDNKK